MKTRRLIFLTAFMLFGTLSIFAQEKTETFKVYGNCGMCEKRIEKAANAIEGVQHAQWDKKTKVMEVKFDSSKTNLKQIEQAITNVGHDTEMFTAKSEVYNKLPKCCKYDRKE